MRTYRELFRTPEFKPFFASTALNVAAQTVSGLALGTLIYDATGSPLLSALAIFGPSLAQVVGMTTLLAAADRLPPRAALAGLGWIFAAGTAAQAMPGQPVFVAFSILFVVGVVSSVGGGVRWGLLNQLLSKDGYLLGRSVLNMSVGVMQICGFATGGVLVAVLSPRGALLTGAALYCGSAVVAGCFLTRRAPRSTQRVSVAVTWRNNRELLSPVQRRRVFLALWLPNGLIVGCESLFVAYSPTYSGLLFAAAACGMLVGDTLAGRFRPQRLAVGLYLLLAAPYLVFFLRPPLTLAVAAVAVSAVGYSASLLMQERLMALTPDKLSGQALGLHSSGMLVMQGVAAALAGGIAQLTSPALSMSVMAAASLVVTCALARGLRTGSKSAQLVST
ncbi:hypothetical protein FB561_5354 [Kribbella amoyensis]|uniref:MFS family arabinose efflux permease n=1 Tax=Kribbella amoyensis TaxID=996641 RepID=A0A561BZ36_9ACTN|nr:MFS transporter [Kribbella amoyensis]TWD84179.1 hypothetical protein FB561_5354 [Kribbella amoyensis]